MSSTTGITTAAESTSSESVSSHSKSIVESIDRDVNKKFCFSIVKPVWSINGLGI